QAGRPGGGLKEIRGRRRQMLEIPKGFNEVLQCDFTDYETEDGQCYHIGGVTEYLSRFNLVSKVLDTETAFDLIEVTEIAMREIATVGHTLPKRIVLVTDNGPAMKSRRYRNFIQKTDLLIHIRGQKYHRKRSAAKNDFTGAGTESPNEGSSDTSSFCLAQRPGQELPSYAISEQSGPLSGEQRLVASGLD